MSISKVLGQTIKVYIETKDGVTFEVPGLVTSFSTQTSYPYFRPGEGIPPQKEISLDMHVEGIGPGVWSTSKEIARRHDAPEWKCPYCGRPNEHKRETCSSCGAVRPFVYG